jgi:hypothetical protein
VDTLLGFDFEGVLEVYFFAFEGKCTLRGVEVFAAIEKDLVLEE